MPIVGKKGKFEKAKKMYKLYLYREEIVNDDIPSSFVQERSKFLSDKVHRLLTTRADISFRMADVIENYIYAWIQQKNTEKE